MDLEELVTECKKLLREFERTWGPVALFMLVADDVQPLLGWTLYVSAKGLEEATSGDARRAFSRFCEELRPGLGRWLIGLRMLDTRDPIVRELAFTFGAQKPVVHLQSWNVSGEEIPRAMILKSKKVAA